MFPEIRFSESLALPTYIPYLSLLYCFLVVYVVRRAQRLDRSVKVAMDLSLIMMIAGFVGGRLVHAFYEMPDYYLEDISRLFKFWEGGFVFYGGFIFAFLCCLVYVKKTKISFFEWADFFAPVVALGYGLGRIGCFLSGCCYGAACDLPWGVRFPWDYHQVLRHPTQLYAVIWELAVFVLITQLPKVFRVFRKQGLVFSTWLVLHGLGRLLMESFRDDFRGDTVLGQSISTWVSFGLILAGIFLFVSRFGNNISETRPQKR